MLYNEERPHSFDEMVGQETVVNSIRNQVIKDKFMGVYIFYGQYGSGKTTMARILALTANCVTDENGNPDLQSSAAQSIVNGNCPDYMEVDGASKTGVDEVRKLIDDTAYLPSVLKRKIYIIDEVHMLSKASFNALLKTLEEPPEYAIFVLCTTDFKAIPATVRSRAACYCFSKISDDDICKKLCDICKKRNISASQDACMLIAKNSDGAMRNAESLLEQASICESYVTEDVVSKMLGITDPSALFDLLSNIIRGDAAKAVMAANELLAAGKNMVYMADDMVDIITDAIIVTCSGDKALIGNTTYYKELLNSLTKNVSANIFVSMSKELMKLRGEIRKNESGTALIVTIVQMAGSLKIRADELLSLHAQVDELQGKVNELLKVNNLSAHVTLCELNVASPACVELIAESRVDTMSEESEGVIIPQNEEKTDGCNDFLKVPDIPFTEDLSEDACAQNQDISNKDQVDPTPKDATGFVFEEFNMFDDFFCAERPTVEKNIELKKKNDSDSWKSNKVSGRQEDKLEMSAVAKGVIQKINAIASENAAVFTALNEGTRMEVDGEHVCYVTPLEPIRILLSKYFDVFDIPACVRLDSNI